MNKLVSAGFTVVGEYQRTCSDVLCSTDVGVVFAALLLPFDQKKIIAELFVKAQFIQF